MHDNTTEAMRGQRLAARVLARKDELEDALADISPWDVVERQALEAALMTINGLVIGDLAHPSDVVAHVLSRWLERNKYLAAEITRRHRLVARAE